MRAGTTFEARPLELGRTDGDWVEVLAGLQVGEKYATTNSFILKADVGKAGAGLRSASSRCRVWPCSMAWS